MQDRPEAAELLDAVAEFLFGDVRGWAPPQKRFVVLVAANVCAIVARELRVGEEPSREDAKLFRDLLGEPADAPAGGEADEAAREAAERLAGVIREGGLDEDLEGTAAKLREHVRRKLETARPGYDRSGEG
jgi:Domain of unknown function (DUF6285)